jgi:hypothetical protein
MTDPAWIGPTVAQTSAGELLLDDLNLPVDALQLDDQLDRETASGLPGWP